MMSDNSDTCSEDFKYDQQNGQSDDICRDYLRNVCKRGKRCKYQHPNTDEAQELGRKQDYTFCHDFQNTGCRRNNCKFLHCTREEEEYFRQTGQLPVRLQQAAAMGIGIVSNDQYPLLKGEVPVCKDFLKGDCKRGPKCKYRHITPNDFTFEVRKLEVVANNNNNSIHHANANNNAVVNNNNNCSTLNNNNGSNNHNNHNHHSFEFDDDFDVRFDRYDYSPLSQKRRRIEMDGLNGYESRFPGVRSLSYQLLEDENNLLRRKVDELKKQVADLTATNEVLLEQNARLRVSKAAAAAVPVSQPLTVSQTLTPSVTLATALASAPPPISHLTQQIALNSDLATQHAMQTAQRMARELASASAQAQAQAQSLTPAVTINPASMVPVSLPQNNLAVAAAAAASLAPASIHQSLRPVCSITQSMTQSLPPAPSAPLVSYPIVSQGLRSTVAAPSSLAH